VQSCPYQVAKARAAANKLAVLNTSYWLHEANGQYPTFGGKARRELVVIDEADMLESALMGFVEYEVPQWIASKVGLHAPPKGIHKPRLVKWLRETSGAVTRWKEGRGDIDEKTRRNLAWFCVESERVAGELEIDVTQGDDGEDAGRWQRDYDTKILKLRPLIVGPYGNRYLWRHGRKFLVMSATIISAEEMVDSLGIGREWAEVNVPMTFPVENRRIVVAPVVDVTYKTMQSWEPAQKMAEAILRIHNKHQNQPMLVHTGSYKWTSALYGVMGRRTTHTNVWSYTNSPGSKGAAFMNFRAKGGILLAPSMSRGVDLPGDLCRICVIAKVPFPSLADRQVSGRLHLPGGQQWYNVQVIRDIVQMTGRGVRSESDHCVTYILDGQFGRVWRNRSLFPAWWREAVDNTQSIGWLL
jgi:ATP-dependent DNA helicase DinG